MLGPVLFASGDLFQDINYQTMIETQYMYIKSLNQVIMTISCDGFKLEINLQYLLTDSMTCMKHLTHHAF